MVNKKKKKKAPILDLAWGPQKVWDGPDHDAIGEEKPSQQEWEGGVWGGGGAAMVWEREREREWLLRVSGKEKKKKMGFITIMPPVIHAKICKNTTDHLNSVSIHPKTIISCSLKLAFECCFNSDCIWIQMMKTIAKQQNFNSGPLFFGFKHRKLFLNPITKHALWF